MGIQEGKINPTKGRNNTKEGENEQDRVLTIKWVSKERKNIL